MDLVGLLASRPLVVGDGSTGRRLMAFGLGQGECPESLNLRDPAAVEQVHREYVEAGADFVITNTLGGTELMLRRHGLGGAVEQVNCAGAEIALRAAAGCAAVLGDVGPTGQLLQPYGELAPEEARSAFAAQAAALSGAGVGAIILETFTSAAELRAALEGACQACRLPLIANLVFSPAPRGRLRTIMGERPEDLVRLAEEFGCLAVGTNCGQGIETMPPLVRQLAEMTDLPIIVQPNAGVPRLVGGRTVYPEDAATFARHLPDLHEAGARIIGGCCGTTAEHVRAIRALADSL
jgi:5-methyltetrahydrofolate--homocysteine methyltransferase